MVIARSITGVGVRLTHERWSHIAQRHPEMGTLKESVIETLTAPDMVQKGDSGVLLAMRFYPRTPLTSKHLVIAYRETSKDDGFILTAYLTSNPSAKREVLWTRSES